MADNSLPDEIISEILSPALKVSDEVFSDTSNVSPFAGYSESTSAYLLVCKSWLRVATPLLYNVVILRSKAQAKALGQVLSKNKDLGQFIKKLRVEGGYGAPMGVILQSSPHISDLFISFEIWATDDTRGLCKGLPLINPTRLIIRDLDYKRLENKMTVNLEDALAKAILKKWDHLTICDLPYLSGGAVNSRASKIFNALATSRRLKTVAVPCRGAPWVHSFLKDCPLQAIQLKPPIIDYYLAQLRLDDNPTLKALVRFKEEPPLASVLGQDSIGVAEHPPIAPSLNPFFIPMNTESKEVQDIIWTRISYFAMSVPELAQNPTQTKLPPRLPPLSVSKIFNRLAFPHLYAHIRLSRTEVTSKLSSVFLSNPSLGPLVRNICDTSYHWRSESYSDSDDDSNAANNASADDPWSTVLSQTTGLVRFCSGYLAPDLDQSFFLSRSESSIPWAAFEAVVNSSGRTLREFSYPVGQRRQVSADIFNGLTQLRRLDWKCDTSFECDLVDGHRDGFSKLEELRIWSQDSSFLTVLSRMKLPSLRRLLLWRDGTNFEAFLQTHGSKLTHLCIKYNIVEVLKVNIFDVCPNLGSLTLALNPFMDYPPRPETFPVPLTLCCSLGKLKFTMRDKTVVAKWESFFAAFEPKHFPDLREIEMCFEWPTSEREIAKSCWVRWADNLLKHNINLTDNHGKKWRPRLKAKR
ncbi:hypothetical protein DFH09DRAFT_1386536 [Mycena vulgaris]|nr:hypothetical protein DFH09DRAFT_1386536 [Mycena vulgaris]